MHDRFAHTSPYLFLYVSQLLVQSMVAGWNASSHDWLTSFVCIVSGMVVDSILESADIFYAIFETNR